MGVVPEATLQTATTGLPELISTAVGYVKASPSLRFSTFDTFLLKQLKKQR